MCPRLNNIYTKTSGEIIVFDFDYFARDFRGLIYLTTWPGFGYLPIFSMKYSKKLHLLIRSPAV